MENATELTRCDWAMASKIEREYHDREWGVPEHGDLALFERLILEGMQAGLSWRIILQKREAMREAFDGFDPEKLQGYGEEQIQRLMGNPAIIRNRRKIEATVSNAKTYFRVREEFDSLDRFLWRYVDFTPIQNHWARAAQIPSNTPLSDRISKDMKALGFKFVGSTIIYALMQSIGMVNDHLTGCFCYPGNQ